MDGVHQGHQLQPDYKQQHNRLTSARGGVTGPPQSLDFQEACTGAGYIPSSAVSWLPRHTPEICYRPIRPSDLDVIRELHEALFPVRYETEFFLNVVHGHGIISWAAVDTSRSGLLRDEIIGFVTTRVVSTEEVDTTGMLGYELAKAERDLVYILTLGVIKSYRNNGIASSLIHKVLDYASTIPTCRAVYLHVISYNVKAISFYEKNSFRCLQKLQNFYFISEHHYDAYLYIYYVNGGRPPCSAISGDSCALVTWSSLGGTQGQGHKALKSISELEEPADFLFQGTRSFGDLLISMRNLLSSFFVSMVGRFWRKDPKKAGKWPKHKESGFFGALCNPHGSTDNSTSVCV